MSGLLIEVDRRAEPIGWRWFRNQLVERVPERVDVHWLCTPGASRLDATQSVLVVPGLTIDHNSRPSLA